MSNKVSQILSLNTWMFKFKIGLTFLGIYFIKLFERVQSSQKVKRLKGWTQKEEGIIYSRTFTYTDFAVYTVFS